jgi:hypothetical protein
MSKLSAINDESVRCAAMLLTKYSGWEHYGWGRVQSSQLAFQSKPQRQSSPGPQPSLPSSQPPSLPLTSESTTHTPLRTMTPPGPRAPPLPPSPLAPPGGGLLAPPLRRIGPRVIGFSRCLERWSRPAVLWRLRRGVGKRTMTGPRQPGRGGSACMGGQSPTRRRDHSHHTCGRS